MSSLADRFVHHGAESVLVSNADKLHNARSVLTDYLAMGEDLWSRFNAAREQQLWYYRQLANTYLELGSPLATELNRTVTALETAVAGAADGRA